MAATTLDPSAKNPNATLSNGNLTLTTTPSAYSSAISTNSKTKGKWYFEVTVDSAGGTNSGNSSLGALAVGLVQGVPTAGNVPGQDAGALGYSPFNTGFYGPANNVHIGGAVGAAPASVIGVAVDIDNSNMWIYTPADSLWDSTAGDDPGTAVGGLFSTTWYSGTASQNAVTLSSGNLKVTALNRGSGQWNPVWSNVKLPAGSKTYFEIAFSGIGTGTAGVAMGIGSSPIDTSNYPGLVAGSFGVLQTLGVTNAQWFINNVGTTLGYALTAGVSVLGFALDTTAGKIWVTKDGTTWNAVGSGDNPATATGGINVAAMGTTPYVGVGTYANNDAATVNFGATSFSWTPPSGFSAIGSPAGASMRRPLFASPLFAALTTYNASQLTVNFGAKPYSRTVPAGFSSWDAQAAGAMLLSQM